MISLLNNLINTNAEKYGLKKCALQNNDKIVSIYKENYHYFIKICEKVTCLSIDLQMSISLEDGSVRMMLFPSPRIVNKRNVNDIIQFLNIANRYLYRGLALGRFWVDVENLDLAYEILIPDELLETKSIELMAKQLFEVPLMHFQDLITPLTMLRDNLWDAKISVNYLTELREQGYVDNEKYGL